jgi:hypothetical protein
MAQPAQPDRQSRDNPLKVREDTVVEPFDPSGPFEDADVIDLLLSVQGQADVQHPDSVVVAGPYPSHLEVSVNRRGDVTLHPFQLNDDAARLPAEWFEEGDRVSVTRG